MYQAVPWFPVQIVAGNTFWFVHTSWNMISFLFCSTIPSVHYLCEVCNHIACISHAVPKIFQFWSLAGLSHSFAFCICCLIRLILNYKLIRRRKEPYTCQLCYCLPSGSFIQSWARHTATWLYFFMSGSTKFMPTINKRFSAIYRFCLVLLAILFRVPRSINS